MIFASVCTTCGDSICANDAWRSSSSVFRRRHCFGTVDREEIERFSDDEDWERLDPLCATYNCDRLQALGRHLAASEESRARCADIIKTLESFFDFVDRVSNMA